MKDKILHSGIFKLDDDGRPVGIVKLTPEKNLSSETTRGKVEFDTYTGGRLKLLIEELELAIMAYQQPTQAVRDFFREEAIQPFVDSLKEYGLTPEKIGIDLKRAEKLTWKDTREHKTALENPPHTKNGLTFRAFSIFHEYTPYRRTDVSHYLEHVFKACGIEDTFQAITRRYRRLNRYFK